MSNNKKKKRKKVTYIDDGRTLYDMSSVGGGRRPAGLERGGCKEQIATYLRAVRSMMIPMFIAIAAICIVFLLLYIIFEIAA